jgi:hypothetical protein
MSQRDYNHIYHLGPLCLQIMQDGQHDGIIIDLLPQVTLAINNGRCHVAVAFNWICGTVNIGVMTKEFREGERKRLERVRELADKMGITPRQYELRWDGEGQSSGNPALILLTPVR